MRKWIRVAEWLLIAVGILCLGYCIDIWVSARLYQAEALRQFDRAVLRRQVRATEPHVSLQPVTPQDGELLGRIQIPRLHLSVMVVQGDGSGELKHAAGHIPGTALPGHSGNVGIAAHRDTFFRPLQSIRRDDTIRLSSLDGTWTYRVVSTKVVDPTDVKVLYPTRKDTLTLVTCFPFYYVGSAPKRFIVTAQRLPG